MEEKLFLRNGAEEISGDITDSFLTEIDEKLYSIISNCSRNRVFVDNDELVHDIVNLLVDVSMPLHSISVLRTALDDKIFSAPKLISKKSEVGGVTRNDGNESTKNRDFKRRILEIEIIFGLNSRIRK